MSEADSIVAALGLKPHPEGGYYRETFRDVPAGGGRGAMTAIYYLLKAGEESAWHRVDAAEIWHWYAGAPLRLRIAAVDEPIRDYTLGPNITAGARPQIIVPVKAWQSAHTLGPWTLVGCTVGPAFEFSGFEMAPLGWFPPKPR